MAPPKKQPTGYEPGDTVYAHSVNGPVVLKVLASGADGFTGEAEDGEWHKVPHDRYLGHKARTKHSYRVADEGEDGCLLADETGQCRYVAGKPPQAPEGKPNRDNAHRFAQVHTEDRKLDGMGSLSKAFMPIPLPPRAPLPSGLALLLKASGESVANRPGLAQRRITDRTGRTSLRWVRAMPEQKKERKHAKPDEADPRTPHKDDKPVPPALHKHGDTVAFRHGDVEGTGKIVASGQDGVTVQTEDGREHMIRHDALLPDHPPEPEPEPEKTEAGGQKETSPDEALTSAKAAHKEAVDKYQTHMANPPTKNKKAHATAADALRQELHGKASALAEAMEAAGYDALTGKKRRDMEKVYAGLGEYLKTKFTADQMKFNSTIKHDVPAAFVAGATGEPMPTMPTAANAYAKEKQDALLSAAYEAGKKIDPEHKPKGKTAP